MNKPHDFLHLMEIKKSENKQALFRENQNRAFENSLQQHWVGRIVKYCKNGTSMEEVRLFELHHVIRRTCKHVIKTFEYQDDCMLPCNDHCVLERSDGLCPDFEVFEPNNFLLRHGDVVYVVLPTHDELRRKKHARVKNEFVRFLLKLFRVRGLTYTQVSKLFDMCESTCKIMIAREFKKCCLEKEECMYKEFL